MAVHVYNVDGSQNEKPYTIGGWEQLSINIPGVKLIDERSGFKSAIYGRMNADGKVDYAYVTAGTDMSDLSKSVSFRDTYKIYPASPSGLIKVVDKNTYKGATNERAKIIYAN